MMYLSKTIRTENPKVDIQRALVYQDEFPKNGPYIFPLHIQGSKKEIEVLVQYVELGKSLADIIRLNKREALFALTLVFRFMHVRENNKPSAYHPDFALHNIFFNQDKIIIIDPFPPENYKYKYIPNYDLLFEYLKLFLSYVENVNPSCLRAACHNWNLALSNSNLEVFTDKGYVRRKVGRIFLKVLFDELRFTSYKRGMLATLKRFSKLAIFMILYKTLKKQKKDD